MNAAVVGPRPEAQSEVEDRVSVDPPPGYWRRADSHYPRPLSPFGRSLLLPAANGGFRHMCEEFGLLAETVEEREIGGWVYRERHPGPPRRQDCHSGRDGRYRHGPHY